MIPSLLLITVLSCKEHYTLPAKASANTNFLVVEGNINVGQDSTIIRLSHAIPVSDTAKIIVPETGAGIAVESDAGGSYPLNELGNGAYAVGYIAPGASKTKYRLNIKTADGNQFISDFVDFKKTPAIDSISWEQFDDGVHIYVNTHDSTNQSEYYRWNFTETWEYHTHFRSLLDYKNGMLVTRPTQIYTCYTTLPSTAITLATTTNLAKDEVYKKQLMFIPTSSHKIGVLYSMLVEQTVLTKDGYNFWSGLGKNTEKLGSLFDPLPSQLPSNIHPVNNTAYPVIGFISATTIGKVRLWIKKVQVHSWAYPPGPFDGCDTIDISHPYAIQLVQNGGYALITSFIVNIECADCRLEGGVVDKPPFWP